MAEQSKPRISNVTKLFVPGLMIGLVVGGLGGAYYSSRFESPTMQEIKPKGQMVTTPRHESGRPEDAPTPAPEEPKTPAPTGPTGSTAPTSPAPAPK